MLNEHWYPGTARGMMSSWSLVTIIRAGRPMGNRPMLFHIVNPLPAWLNP